MFCLNSLFFQLGNLLFWNFEITTYNVEKVILFLIKYSCCYFFNKCCQFFLSPHYATSLAIFQIKCSLVNVMNILLQTKFKKANVMIDLIWRSLPYLNGMFFNTLENVPFHATKLVDRIWNFEINIKTDNIGSFITCLEKSPRWYDGDVRARPQQLRYSYFIIR